MQPQQPLNEAKRAEGTRKRKQILANGKTHMNSLEATGNPQTHSGPVKNLISNQNISTSKIE